jgi:hypothetical protein
MFISRRFEAATPIPFHYGFGRFCGAYRGVIDILSLPSSFFPLASKTPRATLRRGFFSQTRAPHGNSCPMDGRNCTICERLACVSNTFCLWGNSGFVVGSRGRVRREASLTPFLEKASHLDFRGPGAVSIPCREPLPEATMRALRTPWNQAERLARRIPQATATPR